MVVFSEGSDRQPHVEFGDGMLLVCGRSFMDDAVDFYMNLLERLKTEVDTKTFKATFRMEYLNTASSKCLLELFKFLRSRYLQGDKIEVQWFYCDVYYEMLEAGEDYKDIAEPLPVAIVELDKEDWAI